MGDRDHRDVVESRPESFKECSFGLVIERAGRFVEDQVAGLAIEGPRDTKALSLSTTQAHAALSNECVVAIWQFLRNERVDLSDLGSPGGSFSIDGGSVLTESDIAEDGIVDEKNALWDVGDVSLPTRFADGILKGHFIGFDDASVWGKDPEH